MYGLISRQPVKSIGKFLGRYERHSIYIAILSSAFDYFNSFGAIQI